VSLFHRWAWWSVAGLLLGVGASPVEAGRPSEELFPETTAGFAAISSVDALAKHWKETQLGQLMADPVMEPFSKDLRRQFENRWSGVSERLGLTLEDLKGVPGGEVAVGLILHQQADKPDAACLAIVVDVTGHLPQATALLEKVSKNLKQQGAKQTEIKVSEGPDPVVQFDNLPKPKDDPQAEPGTAFYCLSGSLLVASDNLQVLRGILARSTGTQPKSLAGLPGFQEVVKRCARDNGNATAQFRWFIHPLGYVAAMRAATPEQHRRKGRPLLEILRNQGFGAIQGMGGFVDFHVTDEYQLVHRTAVYAPRSDQFQKSMKMLVFPNETEFEPQRWVPRDVATYATFYVDILNAFDNLGPLFNDVLGGREFLFDASLECQKDLDKGVLPEEFRRKFKELDPTVDPKLVITARDADNTWELKGKDEKTGKEQTYVVKKVLKEEDAVLKVYGEVDSWGEVLEGLEDKQKKDNTSPRINLRAELIAHLGKRVTVITAYDEKAPITASERLLFAIETTNADAVRAAMEKTMQTNTDVKQHKFEEHLIWEMIEQEQTGPAELPTLVVPSLTGEEDQGPQPGEEETKDVRLLPHAAVAIAHGHLFVASHLDFLQKVLAPKEPRAMLGANVDCQLVQAAVDQLGPGQRCAWSFSRTDEEYRPTYELIRQGKMPQSETMLARVLNAMFSTGKKGEFRHQKIDGTQMPDYDVVRRYLGAAGMVVSSEPDGWFFKGFALKKDSP
jgi:hypothetical protein